ncbi:unnamed protein product [Owenia fusiformis]|uniref:Uncharacterized protein n=1 Tax=Owenia fusiformis TaxID=6347 RepID=A0A8J1U3W2_OWEFU|nr:unnamed protein product [Owenia fusiformis]
MAATLKVFLVVITVFYRYTGIHGERSCYIENMENDITNIKKDIEDLKKQIGTSDKCMGMLLVNGLRHRVPDSELTASSMIDNGHGPHRARLGTQMEGANMRGGWSAKIKDQNQWIQADLGKIMQVFGVITQGRISTVHYQWVTSYKVSYSTNGSIYKYAVRNNNQIMEGNSDMWTPVLNMFDPVQARYVRINPVSWKATISMRFDIIGC